MNKWSQHCSSLRQQITSWGGDSGKMIHSRSGSVAICHTQFHAFEGTGQAQPYAVVGLCTSGGGQARRGSALNDVWRPGRVGFTLPMPPATGYTPDMEMLAIAFDIDDLSFCHGKPLTPDMLQKATGQLFDDELIGSVMVAMLRDAEAHGVASIFFEHGLSLILNRLALLTGTTASVSISSEPPERHPRLIQAEEIIESRLADDIRVKDLALELGVSARTITRLFQQHSGQTPYQYLTQRRMEKAKQLLQRQTSVTDVALEVGYANPAKFSAAFRRWVGATPSQWRGNI